MKEHTAHKMCSTNKHEKHVTDQICNDFDHFCSLLLHTTLDGAEGLESGKKKSPLR